MQIVVEQIRIDVLMRKKCLKQSRYGANHNKATDIMNNDVIVSGIVRKQRHI